MENLGNDFATTLAAAITTAGQTSVTVASSTGAPSPKFRARVEDELVLVTAVAHPTWTIERGAEGTAAATHPSGAAISHVLTAGGLDQNLVERGLVYEEQLVPADMERVLEAGRRLVVAGPIDVAGSFDCRGSVISV